MATNLIDFCSRLFWGFINLSQTVLDFFTTRFADFIDPDLLPDSIENLTIIEVMLGASITVILVVGIVKFFT